MFTLQGFEAAYAFVIDPLCKLSDLDYSPTRNLTVNQVSNFHIETSLCSDFSRNPYLLSSRIRKVNSKKGIAFDCLQTFILQLFVHLTPWRFCYTYSFICSNKHLIFICFVCCPYTFYNASKWSKHSTALIWPGLFSQQ